MTRAATRAMTSARTVATLAALAVAMLAVAAGDAEAYPQFQLSRDQTCTGCHLSPAGGGLLNENGLTTAETISQWGTSPEFFYGKIPTPSWLVLGGDVRAASGYVQSPEQLLASFPMQIEAYGRATFGGGVSLQVDLGARESQTGDEAATHVWSREHYLTWQQNPGTNGGLYVRLGRFMPVFGLRLAEHLTYIRRWGGTPLYGETYGLAVEYVDPKFEVHATGFIKDPIYDTPEHSNGAAAVGELRLSERFSVGAEGMYTSSDDDQKFRIGALAKLYLEEPAVLLQFEGQFMNQLIEPRGAPKQSIAYLLASRFMTSAIMLDVGLGFFNENIQITKLHRECIDVNLHWFTTSHVEALFTGRFETLAFGAGGPSAGYALAQLHYRL
ncbi:MAG TPA: hypothetical protein VHW23_05285 [Kofleriaceae bacterium]|nr:hypothetical protein [Kofleriaceae bacterium]